MHHDITSVYILKYKIVNKSGMKTPHEYFMTNESYSNPIAVDVRLDRLSLS